MEGICGVFDSELLANWVGALGSAGAAILALVLYRLDKRATLRRDQEGRDSSRRGQAMHIATLLAPVARQIEGIETTCRENPGGNIDESTVPLIDPERLLDALRDPAVFTVKELATISGAAIQLKTLRDRLYRGRVNTLGIVLLHPGNVPPELMEGAKFMCDECSRAMWSIAVGISASTSSPPQS